MNSDRRLFESVGIHKHMAVFQCNGCSHQFEVNHADYLAGKHDKLHEFVIVKREELTAAEQSLATARADNARLQSELRELDESVPKITKALADAEARAEQLAEALRKIASSEHSVIDGVYVNFQDFARAALSPPAPTTDEKGA